MQEPNTPNRSSACDSSHAEPETADRKEVARDLYLRRGASDASGRCDANSKLGNFDLLQTLIDSLELDPGQTLYDVGCGSGQHLAGFESAVGPQGRALGFDFSTQAVRATRANGRSAITADAAALPVADGSCDAITCNFALYYHPDLEAASDEFARVIRPGGRLAISGPAEGTNRELYAFHQEATGHAPSDADLMALGFIEGPALESLARAGFDALECRVFVNEVRFPSASAFLDYWRSTSLFARTPDARIEAGERTLSGHRGAFVNTKRVAVLTGRRQGAG